jgi:hypothetical protein
MVEAWSVLLVAEVRDWFMRLANTSPESADLVAAAIDQLAADGPKLGRPFVDRVGGSKIHNLKELRPASGGRSELRILFVFDYARRAVLLVAGDKSGSWNRWYEVNIPVAERRYQRWLDGGYETERK